jgi:hypothetical protein
MHRIPNLRTSLILATSLSCSVAFAACGSDEATTDQPADGVSESTAAVGVAVTEPPDATGPDATAPDADPPDTDPPDATVVDTEPPPPETTIDDGWREDAVAWCQQGADGLAAIAPPASNEDVARLVQDHIAMRDASGSNPVPVWPAELSEPPTDLDELVATQDEWIDVAAEQLAAGNVGALGDPSFAENAWGSVDHSVERGVTIATVLAIAGVRCGPADPALIAQADLNVPIPDAWQLETGFGSVWVSSREDVAVHRVDPDTGEQLAVIDVDSLPIKLQPADGRMILRTENAYVAIDPATNAVVDTLAMADVGPAAGRSWAVDGGLWICDGQRLHRYDPVSFEPVTTIELGFDCGQVYATGDLVIPWSYNQDPGESGASVAAFIDPATNEIAATIDLPADVNVPVVLDDKVLFPPSGSEPAVVVDRATWTVTSRIDVGEGSGSQPAFDGTSVYIITVGDEHNVTVVDTETLEVTETIDAFEFDAPFDGGVNSIAAGPGAIWVVNSRANLLQRFDRPT